MKKRILSLALASAMAVGTVSGAFAETEVATKTNVPYIQGNQDGEFMPNSDITRQEIAVMVGKALELKGTNPDFKDSAKIASWASEFVAGLQDAEIVEGDDQGNFNPTNKISRAELATMIVRAYEKSTGETLSEGDASFKDLTGKEWYASAVKKAANAGLVKGDGTGNFNATGNASRAQTVVMVNRMLGLEGAEGASELTTSLKDSDEWPSWAKEAILIASTPFEYTVGEDGKIVIILKVSVDSVSVATAEDVATVSAVVKNAEAGAKATVEIYANGDTTAAPAATKEVEIVDGKVSAEFAGLPAGDHVARVKVGEASKDANFTITISELAVQSVSAINAKQIQVTFNKAVDKDTVIFDNGTKDTSDDTLKVGALEITSLDNYVITVINTGTTGAKASLSADGKVLTITARGTSNAEYFNKRYVVAVTTTVKDADKVSLASKYTTNIKVDDTTRPNLTGVTYKDYVTAEVAFSEALATTGTVTFKYADGTSIPTAELPGATTVNADGEIVIDLSPAGVKTNKDIVATIMGATDYNGNVVSPNPVTVTVKKDTNDTTKPVVTSVTATGINTFDIKFSEKLAATPALASVTVNGTAVTSLVKDTTDATVYHATFTNNTAALYTVSVNTFTDLGGNTQTTAYTKAVNFAADTTAPKMVSSKVEQIEGIEYLVLTYDENVTPVASKVVAPTYLDNYVTTPGTQITTSTANFTLYKSVDGKSKAVKLNLSTLANNKTYTADLVKGLVQDLYGNDSEKVEGVSFARTTNSSTDKPELLTAFGANGILTGAYATATTTTADNNKLVVKFDRPVDGLSATTASNYTVEGATVTSAVLKENSTNGIVELTLAKDSNTLSGARAITVSGVKSQAGTVMDTKTTSESLLENVRPTITKAEVTANNTIKLTFSEDVSAATFADVTPDFIVKVGGSTVAVTSENMGTDGDTATLTLTTSLTADQYTQAITLESVSGFNVTDVNGNAMDSVTSLTVAK